MKVLIYDRSLEVRHLIQKYINQISDSVEICAVGNAAMLIPEMKKLKLQRINIGCRQSKWIFCRT